MMAMLSRTVVSVVPITRRVVVGRAFRMLKTIGAAVLAGRPTAG